VIDTDARPATDNVFYGVDGSNWNVATSWSRGFVPTKTDSTTVIEELEVVLDTSTTVSGMELSAGALLEIDSTGVLTVGP
jgi:hypothetical protein